jgi:hypothetical protein
VESARGVGPGVAGAECNPLACPGEGRRVRARGVLGGLDARAVGCDAAATACPRACPDSVAGATVALGATPGDVAAGEGEAGSEVADVVPPVGASAPPGIAAPTDAETSSTVVVTEPTVSSSVLVTPSTVSETGWVGTPVTSATVDVASLATCWVACVAASVVLATVVVTSESEAPELDDGMGRRPPAKADGASAAARTHPVDTSTASRVTVPVVPRLRREVTRISGPRCWGTLAP